MRRILVLSLTLALTAGSMTGALAAWVTSGTGTAQSSAGSLPQGNTPTVPTNSTGSVEVSWAANTPPSGVTLDGYRIERHPVGETDPLEFTLAGGSCAGTVDALTCTDEDVPEGDWQYRVSPRLAEWHGERSDPSSTVSVAATTTIVMIVDELADTYGGSGSTRTGTVTATVTDLSGNPISGAQITGQWTWNVPGGQGGTNHEQSANCSASTDVAGQCTIQKTNFPNNANNVVFTVTSVDHLDPQYEYNADESVTTVTLF